MKSLISITIAFSIILCLIPITFAYGISSSYGNNPHDASPNLTSAFQHGYLGGVSDGKASARDSGDVCESYNSTADSSECLNGYNLGFKKGCIGMMWYHDEYPEYPTCADYFNLTQK